jgi:hypothetical protein
MSLRMCPHKITAQNVRSCVAGGGIFSCTSTLESLGVSYCSVLQFWCSHFVTIKDLQNKKYVHPVLCGWIKSRSLHAKLWWLLCYLKICLNSWFTDLVLINCISLFSFICFPQLFQKHTSLHYLLLGYFLVWLSFKYANCVRSYEDKHCLGVIKIVTT